MQAIIIDDQAGRRDKLGELLSDFCEDIQLLGKVTSLSASRDLINNNTVQLAFVHVDFGLESIAELWSEEAFKKIEIIFLCGKEHQYIDIFEKLSMEYLTLPVTISKLIKGVKNIEQLQTSRISPFTFEQSLIQEKNINRETHELVLSLEEGREKVLINSILYCKYDGTRTHFNLASGEHLIVNKNMKIYEDLLVDYGFIRTHNSALPNLRYVKNVDRAQLTMTDNYKIPVSKVRRKELEERLKEYI